MLVKCLLFLFFININSTFANTTKTFLKHYVSIIRNKDIKAYKALLHPALIECHQNRSPDYWNKLLDYQIPAEESFKSHKYEAEIIQKKLDFNKMPKKMQEKIYLPDNLKVTTHMLRIQYFESPLNKAFYDKNLNKQEHTSEVIAINEALIQDKNKYYLVIACER